MSELHTTFHWRATGLSPRDIQLQAAQLQLKLRETVDPYCPHGHNGDSLTPAMRDRLSQLLQRFLDARKNVLSQATLAGQISSHPWAGVTNATLDPAQFSAVGERLTQWQACLVSVSGLLGDLGRFLPAGTDASVPMTELGSLIEALEQLPEPDDDVIWEYLPSLTGERLRQSRNGLDMFLSLGALSIRLAGRLSPWDMFDRSCLNRHQRAVTSLSKHLAAEASLGQVREVLMRTDSFVSDLNRLAPELEALNALIRLPGEAVFTTSCNGLGELEKLLGIISAVPHSFLQWRDPALLQPQFDTALAHLRRDLDALNQRAETLGGLFDLNALPSINQLERIRSALDGGKSSLWLNTRGRAVRQELTKFCHDEDLALAPIVAALPALIEYAISHKALNDHPIYAKHLGRLYQGPDTDVRMAETLRAWYRAVQRSYSGERARLGQCIVTLPDRATLSIRKLRQQHQATIEQALDTYHKLHAVLAEQAPLRDNHSNLLDPAHGIASVARELRQALDALNALATDDQHSIGQLIEDVKAQSRLIDGQTQWEEFRQQHALFQGMEMEIHGSVTSEAMLRKAIATLALADCIQSVPLATLRRVLEQQSRPRLYEQLRKFAATLKKAQRDEETAREAFAELVELDLNAWMQGRPASPGALRTRNQLALQRARHLNDWLNYIATQQQLHSLGLGRLADAIIEGRVSVDQADLVLQAAVMRTLALELNQAKTR